MSLPIKQATVLTLDKFRSVIHSHISRKTHFSFTKKFRSLMASSGKKIGRESKYRTVAVTATPFIVLGGICIGFGWRYVSRAWTRKPKQNLARSMSFAAIHGGKLAMERLVDYQNYQRKETQINVDINELKSLLENDQPPFKELQRVLGRLEMSRREDEAIKMLTEALEKAQNEGKSHEAYEIEMLLAEMYIYKGDIQNALKCQCLKDEQVSADARRPLFKAIISLMDHKEQEEVALKNWRKFKEMQNLTTPPTFYDEFIEFKKAVNLIKQDIIAASRHKKQ